MQVVTVRPDNGEEFRLKIAARDTLVWEKSAKPFRSFIDFMRNPDMTNLYRLAHIAGTRQGLLNGQTLAEFERDNDVLFDEDDDDNQDGAEDGSSPDPTQSGATPEPS